MARRAVGADASAVSHMSERPQEVRAHARGRAYRKALCCCSLPGKSYCLKYPAVFLSEATVYFCFVCNLELLAPAPPTAGTVPHICLAALVFFR